MNNPISLTLDTVKFRFGTQKFTATDLYDILKQTEPDLPLSTLRWRLYSLKASGDIEQQGRGVYAISSHEKFEFNLPHLLQKISKEILKEFPHARFCVWSSEILNQFTVHQPSVSFSLIEVEKDALESVFSFLQEDHKSILLNPSKKEIDHYLLTKTKSIIVKPLIQRAPLEKTFPKLEKILVDLLAEPDLFSLYQGSEVKNIWKEIFHKYTINSSSLGNYAKRRNIAETVDTIICELNLLSKTKETRHDSI